MQEDDAFLSLSTYGVGILFVVLIGIVFNFLSSPFWSVVFLVGLIWIAWSWFLMFGEDNMELGFWKKILKFLIVCLSSCILLIGYFIYPIFELMKAMDGIIKQIFEGLRQKYEAW